MLTGSDYLRRDSLFTGAGYGHYDHFRLLHTFQLHQGENGYRDLVWTEKAMYAIEEYIFSRFYMYQNVYMHKTTRGYEKLLHRLWERAKALRNDGVDVALLKPIEMFWSTENPSVRQYLAYRRIRGTLPDSDLDRAPRRRAERPRKEVPVPSRVGLH